MTTLPAVELHGVGKRYRQYAEQDLLVKRLLRGGRRTGTDLWALRDIDLEVGRGETLGVIGQNGSGKTTLLRLLSGVSAPTTGRLAVRGVIAPLIGVGVGFKGELTGRENVELNGRLLGLTAQEVTSRFDSIVDFSEIEPFIDTPVKYYSSGMFLRLAFAVAVHVRPEVLIVDEVLAVGDQAFQSKCTDRMRSIQDDGTTIVLVTHALPLLDRMAPRTVVLSGGRLIYDGPTSDAIGEYHRVMSFLADAPRTGDERYVGGASVTPQLLAHGGTPLSFAGPGERFFVDVVADLEREVREPRVGVLITNDQAGACFVTFSDPTSAGTGYGPGRPFRAQIELTNRLLTGTYSVLVTVRSADGNDILGEGTAPLFVSTHGASLGIVDLEPVITVDGRDITHVPDLRLR